MALFSVAGVQVLGIGAAVPAAEKQNRNLDILSEKERQEIIDKVGIDSRRVAPAHTCTSDLCIAAARQLMQKVQIAASSIGIVVFVTQTPDYLLPGNSMLAQQQLDLSKSVLLYDVNQGCAGYIYGLSLVAGMMQTTNIEYGLLLVGDTITRLVSANDRSTVPIFSDAGTATLLGRGDTVLNQLFFNIAADSNGFNAIGVKAGGARYPFSKESLTVVEKATGVYRSDIHLAMEGIDVLNYSLKNVVPNIHELMTYSGSGLDDIDYFVLHQANRILNDSILKRIGVGAQKAPETLSVFGNTSSATIPLTIACRLANALDHQKRRLLLSGFGVGFSWGSALFESHHMIIPEIIEI